MTLVGKRGTSPTGSTRGPIQKVRQQSTGGLLFLTPKVVTRVLVHDLMVCQPHILAKRELGV